MKNKEIKKSSSQSDDWKKLYESEEKKYRQYLETTKITNLSDLIQKLTPDNSTIQILTDY